MSRRAWFDRTLSLAMASAVSATSSGCSLWPEAQSDDPDRVAADESFWAQIAAQFPTTGGFVILNGGGQNPSPTAVTAALQHELVHVAAQPRPRNDEVLATAPQLRQRLARMLGADAGEVALTRNTTEGLNIIANGVSLGTSDEVLVSSFERYYGGQIFAAHARRRGYRVRTVELPPEPDDDAVVAAFAAAMTPAVRLLVVSRVVDYFGYLLPIARLTRLAHEHNARLLVDDAIGFANVPVDVRQLDCDYYATSLHKWLSAPLGTGLLFVRRSLVADLHPLYGVDEATADDVTKFEDTGTRMGALLRGVQAAVDFHERLGGDQKLARLRFLHQYWTTRVAGVAGITIRQDRERRTAQANLVLDAVPGPELSRHLRERCGIWTFGPGIEAMPGIYVAPNVFTLVSQLDHFVAAIRAVAAGGLAAPVPNSAARGRS